MIFPEAYKVQGSYPFSETNFQDFSRTLIDFSSTLTLFSRCCSRVSLGISMPDDPYFQ